MTDIQVENAEALPRGPGSRSDALSRRFALDSLQKVFVRTASFACSTSGPSFVLSVSRGKVCCA